MDTYHKIQTIFKRDRNTNKLLPGEWTKPEFQYLAKNQWDFTEKVDGTNVRVHWDGTNVKFGGRTDNAQMPIPLMERLNERFNSDTFADFSDFGEDTDITLYGEGYGPKIQGGGNYREDQDFVLFDVKIAGWWLQRENVCDIATKLSIDVVPIVGKGTLYECIELVKPGMQSTWGDFESEGIVARPTTEMCMRDGNRIITKIKTRDFRA